MKSILFYFVSFLILMSIGLPKKLAEVSQNLKSQCEGHLTQSEYHELNSALICGTSLRHSKTKKQYKLFWRPWHIVLVSGIISLALFPDWLTSLSLLMSWVCALALSLTKRSHSHLRQHATVYFVLLPILSSLSIPHPLVIVV